ncbi:iron donor protein CyaY [Parapusillimonas sp. SGNA-6]|jgi:CyaY protein|nr:iron donor protein CyaY [Parapusillimonas sp. SGNA-6]
MNETEFIERGEAILDSIESQAGDWVALYGVNVETSRSGHALTLIFDDAIQVAVSLRPAEQGIGVTAPSGGLHYRFDGLRWNDTRGGPALSEALSQICSEATGQPIKVII